LTFLTTSTEDKAEAVMVELAFLVVEKIYTIENPIGD
jgi:hypothetical protein